MQGNNRGAKTYQRVPSQLNNGLHKQFIHIDDAKFNKEKRILRKRRSRKIKQNIY
jgi:hypothetical protein